MTEDGGQRTEDGGPGNEELVFEQGPIMTERHCEAMRQVVRLWPYPDVFERGLLADVVRHLEALNGSPVPVGKTTDERPQTAADTLPAAKGYLDDWQVVWRAPTVEECYDCDQ